MVKNTTERDSKEPFWTSSKPQDSTIEKAFHPVEKRPFQSRSAYRRVPRHYDGTRPTTHRMVDVLPAVLSHIGRIYQQQPDLILAAWPEIIGPHLQAMTEAVSYVEGILTVKVKNSTLYSLLRQKDKPKILRSLREKFPRAEIRDVYFRLG